MPRNFGLVLLAAVIIVFASYNAKAGECTNGCRGYDQSDPTPCDGCEGMSYVETYCTFGCTCGTCEVDGNSGKCCGSEYHNDEIVPTDGTCECGNVRVHASTLHSSAEHRAELLQGRTPGLIMLSATESYKPAEMVYTYRSCSHRYVLVVQGGRIVGATGM